VVGVADKAGVAIGEESLHGQMPVDHAIALKAFTTGRVSTIVAGKKS
jgi:hypothetical protein